MIKQAIEQYEQFLNDTQIEENEQNQFTSDLQRLKDALKTIENANEVKEEIEQLPSPLTLDNEKLVNDLIEKYENLTDHEKELVGEDAYKKLLAAKEEIEKLKKANNKEHDIIEGQNQIVDIKDRQSIAVFISEAESTQFLKILVDGVTVDSKDYDLGEDKTTITLHHDFLDSLENGEHTLDIVTTLGIDSTNFTIEHTHYYPILYTCIASCAIIGTIWYCVAKKKKQQKEVTEEN